MAQWLERGLAIQRLPVQMQLAAILIVLLLRKALANNNINSSGLDNKWQLSAQFFKPALRQYTSLSLR